MAPAHPDKDHAERLHQENPKAYGDANHKPEMAIALTPFEAMCGFRRLEEVAFLIRKHPEFANCLSEEAKLAVFLASDFNSQTHALQKMFSSFMGCPKDVSERNLRLLITRLAAEQSKLHPHPHDEPAWERKCARAVLRLSQQFPDDPGAMAPLFLNYLLIAPGESFFMAANEPHAYVAGEIIGTKHSSPECGRHLLPDSTPLLVISSSASVTLLVSDQFFLEYQSAWLAVTMW